MSATNFTGINHWWTFEEDSIGGVGRYMVNVATGNLIVQADDMAITHKGISLAFRRTYNSYSQHDYVNTDGSVVDNYGDGWTNTFDAHIAQNTLNDPHCGRTGISVYDIEGARYDYAIAYNSQTQSCYYVPPTGEFNVLTYDNATGWYYWTKKSGAVYMFHNPTDSNVGIAGRLAKIWARNNNNKLVFTYSFDAGASPAPSTLHTISVQTETTSGHSLSVILTFANFNTKRLLSTLAWPDGTVATYRYDSSARLVEVDEPANTPSGPTIPQMYTYTGTSHLLGTVNGGRWSGESPNPSGVDGGQIDFDYSGSAIVDAKYYGWVNQINDGGGNSRIQPVPAINYGAVSGSPYRFVSFATWGSGSAPSPGPTSSPTAGPAACPSPPSTTGTVSWYDSDGHEQVYCYDSTGRVVQTDGWTGTLWLVTKQTWDASNDLISSFDARSNETDFAYDTNGNLIAQAAPSTTVLYNGNLVTMRSTNLYSYDVHNNLVARCDPVVVHAALKDWSATPAPSDTLCSTSNGISNFASMGWAAALNGNEPFGELVNVTTALGYRYTISYSSTSQGGADYGLPTSVTGMSFQQGTSSTIPQETYTYDALGNVLCSSSAISATTNATIAYQYDTDNRVVAVYDPDDGSSVSVNQCGKPQNNNTIATTTTYNPNGSIATTTTPSEAAAGVSTSYTYDLDGNKTAELNHFGSQAKTTLDYYDGADRLVEVVKPYDSNSDTVFNMPWETRYYYDLGAGQSDTLTTQGLNSAQFTVSGHGNLFETLMFVNTTDGLGHPGTPYWEPTQFDGFDALNRPVADYRPRPTDCLGTYGGAGSVADCDTFYEATHVYDGSSQTLGLQTSLKRSQLDPELEFSYDTLGRIVAQQNTNSPERSYVFDPDGRDAQMTLSGVGTESLSYDLDGKEVSMSEPQATGFSAPATYTYAYYANGWMSGVTAVPSGATNSINYTYSYRWDGKPATTKFTYGSDSYTFTYHQTTAGREVSMDDPYSPLASPSPTASPCSDARCETYDTHGRLKSIALPEGAYSAIAYDPESDMTSYTAGGSTITNAYNDRGELYKQSSTQGTTTLLLTTMMGYASAMTASQETDVRAGVATGVGSFDGGPPPWSSISTYGKHGNNGEVQQQFGYPDGQGGTTYVIGEDDRTFDDENHLSMDSYTSWNCSGNWTVLGQGMLTNNSDTFVWGPNGHPILSSLALSGLQSKSESLHWSGDQLIFTSDSNGNVDDIKIGAMADYIPGAQPSNSRLTVWDRDLSGFIASAHNGTGDALWGNLPVNADMCASSGPQALKNNLGFGSSATPNFTLPSGLAQVFSTSLGIGFTGSPPTGLFVYNRPDGITNQFSTIQGVRSYDPATNSWMTPDALGGFFGNPASQRAYSYDGNSPFDYVDPTGFGPVPLSGRVDPIGALAAVAGATANGTALSEQVFESNVISCIKTGVCKTPDVAAAAAIVLTREFTNKTGLETGGNIYYDPSTGNYGWNVVGTDRTSEHVSIDPSDIPAGTEYAGSWHQHPTNDNFSSRDETFVYVNHKPLYVGLPDGDIMKLEWVPNLSFFEPYPEVWVCSGCVNEIMAKIYNDVVL